MPWSPWWELIQVEIIRKEKTWGKEGDLMVEFEFETHFRALSGSEVMVMNSHQEKMVVVVSLASMLSPSLCQSGAE